MAGGKRRMNRTVGALVCVIAAEVLAQPAPAAFRQLTPETVSLPAPSPRTSSIAEARFADRTFSLLQPEDPALAFGAFELLQAAPPAVIERVRTRMEEGAVLDRVMERATPEIKNRFNNSPSLLVGKLLNSGQGQFLSMLEEALTSGDQAHLSWLAVVASGFRTLPKDVGARVIAAANDGRLKGQLLGAWTNLLLQYPADLAPLQNDLRAWLRVLPKAGDELTKHRTALQALLRLGADVEAAKVVWALRDGDTALTTAVLSYLGAKRGEALADTALGDLVAAVLFNPDTSNENFRAAHSLLTARWPAKMEATYKSTPIGAQNWPASRTAEWVSLAPAAVAKEMSSLSLRHPSQAATAASCDDLRYGLAVLTQRAKLGQPVLSDFWALTAATPHNCKPSQDVGEVAKVASAIDQFLDVVPPQGSAAQLNALAASGPGQLADMQIQSARLARALAPRMAQSVRSGQWAMSRQFLQAGVRMDGEDLSMFWNAAAPGLADSQPSRELYARLVLAAGKVSPAVAQRLSKIAADVAVDAESRAWALIALAATGTPAQHQELLISALADHEALVARTAMGILGRLYEGGLAKKDFKKIDDGLIGDALTRGDDQFKNQARALLTYLAPFGDQYAQLFIQQSPLDGPRKCSVLLSTPMTVPVELALLDAADRNDGFAGDIGRACLGALVGKEDPLGAVVLNWNSTASEPSAAMLLQQMRELWKQPSFVQTGLAKKFVSIAAVAAGNLGYVGNGEILGWWADAAKQHDPRLAERIQFEKSKRAVLVWLGAVPLAVLIHLALWIVLLSVYPRSASVQAIVFWNPFVRKLLGLGYIDLVLLYVPYARTRLFAPFMPDFLRHVCGEGDSTNDHIVYYAASLVTRRDARSSTQREGGEPTPIVSALSSAQGRVLLLGKSGLGKSSFLRFWLSEQVATRRKVMVYLRADECRDGVETEITRRMKAIGSDQSLLRSMLYAGRLNVYIDGYNEVDLKTQDQITAFLGDYPRGNILVASQIPLRGFTSIDTYELMPLSRAQTREFLESRVAVLPSESPVQGAVFTKIAEGFLADTWAKANDDDAKAFDEILSNPMDLTSIAMLLAGGSVPDLFALENQQFEAVKARMSAQQQLHFRIEAFSKAVLQQRLEDQEDLQVVAFKPEVAELVRAKLAQIRTFADPGSKLVVQEIRFRHDRIRDYFTHFAFLTLTTDQVAEKAGDARFAGVFRYLARAMPAAIAEEVRERLIRLAADMEDHRVSDSFIREYGWRQRLAPQDPPWLLAYDLPDGRMAETQLDAVQSERRRLEVQINVLYDRVSLARRHARLLTCADTASLSLLGIETLYAVGAKEVEGASAGKPELLLRSPRGIVFALNAIAHQDRIRDFHVALVATRVESGKRSVLLLVNSQAAIPPEERAAELTAEAMERLRVAGAAVISASQLYAAYRGLHEGHPELANELWQQLESAWKAHGSISEEEEAYA
jgi:hypothetical protein